MGGALVCRKLAVLTFAVIVVSVLTTAGYGQLLGVYEFDGGGDGTSWDDPANWEQVLDPFGTPISGNPATPPDAVTSAEIPLNGVVIDNTMPGQTALDARVGTANGAGSLLMSGGGLTVRDLLVGADGSGTNGGSFDLSGGTAHGNDDIVIGAGSIGTMTMSGGTASTGDDFDINGGSSVTITGGNINIGDRLNMLGNASLFVDGGDILADDDFFFFEDSQITVDSGSMIVNDKLRFDDSEAFNGKLTINGGFVRSNEFGLEIVGDLTDFRGVVEINGDGVYQVEAPGVGSPISQLSVAVAKALINEGVHLITSELAPRRLGAKTVIVPEFDGRQNVVFTQISVVPEPSAVALLAIGFLGLAMGRRRS